MANLSVTDEELAKMYVDDTREHMRRAMSSLLSAMHVIDSSKPVWSILQNALQNIAKASIQLEDDVKAFESEA